MLKINNKTKLTKSHSYRSSAFIVNFEYFTPFSSVSIVHFEQETVNWVSF